MKLDMNDDEDEQLPSNNGDNENSHPPILESPRKS
jgi:hypothetical protein